MVIKTYEAPALELHPTETGIDALQQAARRTGAFYGQAAEDISQTGQRIAGAAKGAMEVGLQMEEHRETTAGMKNFAALVSNKTDEWNKIAANADPNDPTIKQKFLEQLEPDLEKFSTDGFITENGRKFAENHAAQFRQHMIEKTSADMSRLAGEAAVANTKEAINKYTNTAYNDSSSMDFAIGALRDSIDATVRSSPTLGANAGHIRNTILEDGTEKIVKAAAIGAITRTGQVPGWVTDPKYSKYVNGAELEQFRKAAEAQTRANNYYEKQAALVEKQQANLSVHKDATDLMAKGVSVDANGKVMISPDFARRALDIARNNPNAPSAAATVRTMIDWAEGQQRQRAEPLITDPATKSTLMTGMFDPNKPTSDIDILREAANGKLNAHDTQVLLHLNKALTEEPLKGPIYQDTMKAAHAALVVAVPGVPGKDVVGEANYAKFVQNFIPDYLAQKRAGTLPANALDVNDKNSLISQHMNNFHRTLTQRMNDYTELLGGVPSTAPTSPRGVTTNLTGPNTITLPRVTDKAAYDKLEPGAEFTDDHGNRWTKPRKK